MRFLQVLFWKSIQVKNFGACKRAVIYCLINSPNDSKVVVATNYAVERVERNLRPTIVNQKILVGDRAAQRTEGYSLKLNTHKRNAKRQNVTD